MHGKCGKLDPVHNPRALKLAKYLTGEALPAPTPMRDWLTPVGYYPMLGNDVAGDCTFASMLHLGQVWSVNSGKSFLPTRQEALNGYTALTGYDQATGANDNGAQMADVINFAAAGNLPGIKPLASVSVDWTNATEIMQAIDLFGGVYFGIQLPSSAEEQFDQRQPITVPWWPWIRGGHAIVLGGYRDPGFGPDCVLWGTVDPSYPSPILSMSWPFVFRFGDEAHVILDREWFKVDAGGTVEPTSEAPSGLDYEQLCPDLQALAA